MNTHDQHASDPDVGTVSTSSPRIVVGFDGSLSGSEALERAATMAKTSGSTLDVVVAWHYPSAAGGYPLTAAWSPEEDAKTLLHTGLVGCFGEHTPEWVSGRVIEGLPARVLLDASRGADLLVVGSRGHGGFVGLLLGSVSAACAEHATCPVLIMHSDPSGAMAGNALERDLEAAVAE